MTTPVVFDVQGSDTRFGVAEDGRYYAVASDYAKTMGYRDAANATRLLDEDEKGTQLVSTPGGTQRLAVIYEDGMWELIFRSTLPGAKAIKSRVKAILKEIRETGRYEAEPVEVAPAFPVPRSLPEALRAFANEVEAHEETKQRVAELEPAAAAWDKLAAADQDFSVREAAHILNRDPHIETGERRLFAVLRGMGLVDRTDRPYQKHTAHVRLRPRSYSNPATGEETPAKPQVRVTLQGIAYLHKRLGGAVNVHRLVAEEQLALPASTGAEVVR